MTPLEKASTLTALVIFTLVAVVSVYVGYRGWRFARTEAFRTKGNATLWLTGLWILLLWVARDVWYYGIFATGFDPRVWLLGIGIYLVYRRLVQLKEQSEVDLSSKEH